ncbi:MAG: DUF87 domain-containing protein, partial [Pseudomonas aeruginosa]|nr:DUF87 domain-containing protein [Pseudomonas aeruginosa]
MNRLVTRHSAVVGSTGSGKSNAVANLLGAVSDQARFKSARVVLFDLHGEYAKAFGDQARVFRVGADATAGEHELHVPFWALTAEEFISITMGSVSGTPLTLLQERLLSSKRASKAAGVAHGLPDTTVTIDTPLPFSVYQLWHDLYSLHCATHSVSKNQNQTEATRSYMEDGAPPAKALGDGDQLIRPRFRPITTEAGAEKVYGGLYGDMPRAHLDG